MTHRLQYRCAFFVSERRLKRFRGAAWRLMITSKHSRLQKARKKTKHVLYSASVWPWLTNSILTVTLMSPSHSSHYRHECCMRVSTFITRLIMETFMIWEKKKKISWDMHQSQKHIILQHTLQTLWRHVFLLFTTLPSGFCLPVGGSTCSPLLPHPSQVTAKQLNPWCQDYFIAKVAAIDKRAWACSNIV